MSHYLYAIDYTLHKFLPTNTVQYKVNINDASNRN